MKKLRMFCTASLHKEEEHIGLIVIPPRLLSGSHGRAVVWLLIKWELKDGHPLNNIHHSQDRVCHLHVTCIFQQEGAYSANNSLIIPALRITVLSSATY